MGIKQKAVFDAGVSTPVGSYPKDYKIRETSNLGLVITTNAYNMYSVPKSSYAITETNVLAFTYNIDADGLLRNNVVGPVSRNLNIADGERRPGAV
jgi:hypothetical protein